MFFQEGKDTTAAKDDYIAPKKLMEALTDAAGKFNTASLQFGDALQKLGGELVDNFDRLIAYSDDLNKTFVGGRTRMQEIGKAINEAIPGVTRMGGEIKDVNQTLAEIAAGTRTQALATAEDVTQLYAASKVLNTTVLDLVDSFDKVGISYDQISERLTDSINYVQSVGQNARSVMKEVVANTDALSRFDFRNGVMGLTKMATQASMLRFDMKKTLEFADSVLDPEKAIEMAAGFQRLGVAVGSLGDPLMMLNQSLTDPSGLQESLINMTKQFTYFDETAKSFKISQQGILTMRELAETTGISAAELRKTALAAAEMDSKLTKINTTGLNFEVSEENKMLIANVARMGQGGEYEVSIKDERGYEYQKKLTELQEKDFQRIIEQQSKAPKTIEEIQSSQLITAEKMLAEIKALKETMITTFFRMPGVMSGVEGTTKYIRDATGVLDTALRDSRFKKSIDEMEKAAEAIRNSGLSEKEQKEKMTELFNGYKEGLVKLAPQILKDAGVLLSLEKKESGVQVEKFMERVNQITGAIFGNVEGRERVLGGQTPNLGAAVSTSDYSILSKSYSNTALTDLMSRGAVGGMSMSPTININNPSISYSPTINPQLQGVNSPQELIELVNRGGLQLSEQLAKSFYDSIKKLDLQRPTPS